MKIIIKIFIALMLCCNCNSSTAQELSQADVQIVKEIQQGIESVKVKAEVGFSDLIIYGYLAKDTGLYLYNAQPTALLHADEYSIIDYFDKKKYEYLCAYNNSHSAMLAEKAMEDISYKLGSNWQFYQIKNLQNGSTKSTLYFKEKEIAYYEKSKNDTTLVILFTAAYNEDGYTEINTKNEPDTFADHVNKQLNEIDFEILTPDTVKVLQLQNEFYLLMTKAKRGFKNLVLGEIAKDKVYAYYKVVPQHKMQAQSYVLVDSVTANGSYYQCTYTNANAVKIAKYVIENLKNRNDVVWKIENVQTPDKNLIRQNIFANGKFVAYTYEVKAINKYYIAIKNFMRYSRGMPTQKPSLGNK